MTVNMEDYNKKMDDRLKALEKYDVNDNNYDNLDNQKNNSFKKPMSYEQNNSNAMKINYDNMKDNTCKYIY